jgi:hypothetical protein
MGSRSIRRKMYQVSILTYFESPSDLLTYADQVQDILFHSDVVVHYSTCALIQRAVSPEGSNFSQECLEYSRAALNAHMRCNAQFNTKGSEDLWSGYIHWSILQVRGTNRRGNH